MNGVETTWKPDAKGAAGMIAGQSVLVAAAKYLVWQTVFEWAEKSGILLLYNIHKTSTQALIRIHTLLRPCLLCSLSRRRRLCSGSRAGRRTGSSGLLASWRIHSLQERIDDITLEDPE